MAENEVRIVNGTTISTPVYSSSVMNPNFKGIYLHSLAAVPGTAALQNFITLFNPVGSGKMLSLATVALSYTNTATASSIQPVRGWRISAAPTGGTLVPATSLVKFQTSQPTPTGVVRIDNPTAVLDAPIFNSPPPLDNKSSEVHTVDVPPGTGLFSFAPGEGIAISKASGDTTVAWNITLVWIEI
jgi:hypothetical protein